MRIVLATRLFRPEVGAAAFRLAALTDALAERGHEVRVVTTRPPAAAGPLPEERASVSRWPVLRDAGGNVRGYAQYASFDVPLLGRLAAGRAADLVVVEPPPSTGVVVALATLLRRTRYVYYAADVWSDALVAAGAAAPVVAVMRTLERIALRRAARVIAVSGGVAERVVALGVDANRVAVVPNGIDTTLFSPGPAVTREPVFVYTGTMSEWQGADVFVRALPLVREKYPEARLRFFGQGSAEPELRRLAAELPAGSVEFGGVVPPVRAAEELRRGTAALVSIVPGQGYDFARPTKIYAATACGTPVLYAGRGAAADMIRDAGLGAAVGHDPRAVADGMLKMLDAGVPDSAHLVEWTRTHASLRSTGRSVADELEDVLARGA